MLSLRETQALFRDAVTGGAAQDLMPLLRSPGDAEERLAIYRRHHRESFRRHLRGRFPTLEWLLGTDRVIALADATIRHHPPRAPSLAEYGQELIGVLRGEDDVPPYAADVALLDWTLGTLSVSMAAEPIGIDSLAGVDEEALPGLRLTLQPGLAHVQSAWPVDAFVHIRQQAEPPDSLAFERQQTHLELRGARGRFSLQRLAPGDFAFRAALAAGATLTEAADAAAAAQSTFDLSTALAALFAEGLVTHHSGNDHHA